MSHRAQHNMELRRLHERGMNRLPTELKHLILQFIDRHTLIHGVRLCSAQLRDLATPMVFDRLRAEFEYPRPKADHDLMAFKRLWLNNGRMTRVMTDSRRILRPLVKSITITTVAVESSHLKTLLANCPNLTHIGLIIHGLSSENVSRRNVEVMAFVLTTERITHVSLIGDIIRIYGIMARIQDPFTVGTLSIIGRSQLTDPLRVFTHLTPTIAAMLTSVVVELRHFDVFYEFLLGAPHHPGNTNHTSDCVDCAHPLPLIQSVAFGLPAPMHDIRALLVPLIAYVCVKFPRTQTIEFRALARSETPIRDQDQTDWGLLHQPCIYLTALTLIKIGHPQVLQILPILREFNFIGPRAAERQNRINVQYNTSTD
ncbi:hypothetical protein BC940DRAFT_335235 [Gongronella butleri]|nr:hypothetical protein BC940DRAFT_335235 [Gongronella butleri]